MKISPAPASKFRLGLIGSPVSHSLSPRLFSDLGRLLGQKVSYRTCLVAPGELVDALKRLEKLGWTGFNATIPHKQALLSLMTGGLTPQARSIGAVNSVSFSSSGPIGHNTDADGFLDALRDSGFSVKGGTAVVFGAGGAARAVGYALGAAAAKNVTISARNQSAATELARSLRNFFKRTEFRAGREARADIWINATPLGMKGFPSKSPAAGPARCGLAYDLVYGARTPFLESAAAAGAATLDGLDMLVRQALRSWEFWFQPLGARRRRALGSEIIRRLRYAVKISDRG